MHDPFVRKNEMMVSAQDFCRNEETNIFFYVSLSGVFVLLLYYNNTNNNKR